MGEAIHKMIYFLFFFGGFSPEFGNVGQDGDVRPEIFQRQILNLLRHQAEAGQERLEDDVRVQEVQRLRRLRQRGLGSRGRGLEPLFVLGLNVDGNVFFGGLRLSASTFYSGIFFFVNNW